MTGAASGLAERWHIDLGSVRLSLLSAPAPPGVVEVGVPYAGGVLRTWHLVFAPGGPLVLGSGRRPAWLESGGVMLCEPTEPLRLAAAPATGAISARALVLHLPEAVLPLPREVLRKVSGRPAPTGSGPASLLASLVCALAAHPPPPGARHTTTWLGTAAVNLAAAFLDSATAPDGPTGPHGQSGPLPACPWPTPSASELLLHDIKTYIEDHLGDSDLSPASIAGANHISLRYLHRLFQRDGRTVSAFLREHRLERCRAELSDPALAHRSVCEIARRWGFRDPAVFNRTFKSAYGLAPGAYRTERLGPQPRAFAPASTPTPTTAITPGHVTRGGVHSG